MHSQLEAPRIIIFVHFIMAGDLENGDEEGEAEERERQHAIQ